MSLDRNTSIEIKPAANGWIVLPGLGVSSNQTIFRDELMVFETMPALQKWLEQHFADTIKATGGSA